MGLPVARVEVGVADGIATMEHPAIAHIDAHMGDPRRVISPREEHQVAGFGAACPCGDVVQPLRPQPPEVPAALIVDIADEAGTVKGGRRAAAAPQ